jgi:hypothetical protein
MRRTNAAYPTTNHFLKLPCPFLGPTFDHNFLLREEFDRIHALSMHIAEERFFPTAEREERHRRCDTNIDADIACFSFVAEFSCGRA